MFKTRLPELVKQYEERTGEELSQGSLGKKVGLSRQTINNWMSGTITLINADAALKLSRFFNMEWTDLVTLQELPEGGDPLKK